MTFHQVLNKVVEGENLTVEEAAYVMEFIMEGEATPAQIASLLTALKIKGESMEELLGFAKTMREKAIRLSIPFDAIDTCGTGGDGAKTFNVSTAAAIVAAAGGVKVVKHGNRSVSSRSGSADVLEKLQIPINITAGEASEMLSETNLCFLFAPNYHHAMKHAVGPRREIGFRTIMNLLGPLTNPAGVTKQIIGVFDHQYARRIAEVLRELGSEHVLIVASTDGLDEISVSDITYITELKNEQITEYTVQPEDLGLRRYPKQCYSSGTPEENAQTILEVFSGKESADAEIVIANSGAAIYISGNAPSIQEGVHLARELIQRGKVKNHLFHLQNYGKGARIAQ